MTGKEIQQFSLCRSRPTSTQMMADAGRGGQGRSLSLFEVFVCGSLNKVSDWLAPERIGAKSSVNGAGNGAGTDLDPSVTSKRTIVSLDVTPVRSRSVPVSPPSRPVPVSSPNAHPFKVCPRPADVTSRSRRLAYAAPTGLMQRGGRRSPGVPLRFTPGSIMAPLRGSVPISFFPGTGIGTDGTKP